MSKKDNNINNVDEADVNINEGDRFEYTCYWEWI